MTELTWHDLQFALMRCPKPLLRVMKHTYWANKIYVGGFLRSIVAGEHVNDVDIFVPSKFYAEQLAQDLVAAGLRIKGPPPTWSTKDREAIKRKIHTTDNALTLTCFTPVIQIIHRWVFDSAAAVSNSFDFTCCCAAFWYDGIQWKSVCDPRFYPDVAAKRLIYRSPKRNEDPGGSLLRVLKYYQKGFRIPVDSLGAVIARLIKDYSPNREEYTLGKLDEAKCARVITGLLREVDPAIDPAHVAHLPAESIKLTELPLAE